MCLGVKYFIFIIHLIVLEYQQESCLEVIEDLRKCCLQLYQQQQQQKPQAQNDKEISRNCSFKFTHGGQKSSSSN